MTYLPPAVEIKAQHIKGIHGRAVIYWTGSGWDARAPLPHEAIPPAQPPRKSRRDLRQERAIVRARRNAKKGSHRR